MAIVSVSELKGNGFKNLIGKKYGNLTVIGLSDKMSGRKSYWYCKCDCGNEIEVRSDNLTTGNTLSCGCLKKSTRQSKPYEISQTQRKPYKIT